MNFQELVEEVYIKTSRRDRISDTEAAVKAATLKAHRTDYYSKDIVYQEIDLLAPDYRHQVAYETAVPRFRNFKSAHRLCNSGDFMDQGYELTILTPEELLDDYGVAKTDVAYVAGATLNIKASVEFQYLHLGSYVLPNISTEKNYDSWIARMYPFVIVYEAARVVLRSIGKMEESNGAAQLYGEELALLRAEAISDVGE